MGPRRGGRGTARHSRADGEGRAAAVRRANAAGNTDGLRERFPPAHGPFDRTLDANGQSLPVALLLDDGRVVARVGAPYEPGRVVVIDGRTVTPLPRTVLTVGRSPGRQFFAVARKGGVTIHRGWRGPKSATLDWPTGAEGVPRGSRSSGSAARRRSRT